MQTFNKISEEEEPLTKADRVFGKNGLDGVEGTGDIFDLMEKEPDPETEKPEIKDPEEDFDKKLDKAISKNLISKSKETAQKSKERDLEDYKELKADRDSLFKRLEETETIRIITNERDKIIQTFQVKRLTDLQQAGLIDREFMKTIQDKDFNDYTDEEIEKSNSHNYRLLAKTIADPLLTEEEWGTRVDGILVRELSTEVMNFLNNIDEGQILRKFKKK